ncbi:hypothetical protein PF011_g4380 [Phytophthora fragariae]|uniref:Uncharacterized protein n=1 Tax=Phytophthora fragariae TaxID=53985 RepID=A0A6A3LTL7_9STRA|nr:hypothetical protein PF003_g111 [Phytophthora fragariae]KAE9022606.1 hypothetical protein PF011_g4380 [Phytophthora fragariae]KAE9360416.1 hypothetical protein PF008_g1829 [Phytophthora fragariae]
MFTAGVLLGTGARTADADCNPKASLRSVTFKSSGIMPPFRRRLTVPNSGEAARCWLSSSASRW